MLRARRRGARPSITPLALHPLLAAAYPVLFLFAQNVAEQVTLRPLWLPLAGALLGGAVALLLGRVLTGDWLRGALLATLALALFFTFGHAWNLLGDMLDVRRWLIGAYALVAVIGTTVVWRGGTWVRGASGFLLVMLAVGVAINAWSIASYSLRDTTARTQAAAAAIDVTPGAAGRPDIYFIVMDRYAGPETLREQYGFDNSPFLDALRERGFAIAEESWANYLKTGLSLVSTLDMELLDGAALSASAERGREVAAVYDLLQGALTVPTTLQNLGYEWVYIASFWEPTTRNPHADRVIGSSRGDQFSSALMATTALSLLGPPSEPGARTTEAWGTGKEFTVRQFGNVAEAKALAGPTFVFAHFLVPHPPYVFDTDGSTPTEEERAERSEEEEYVRQLQWTNGRLLELIDELLDVPAGEEPIIILQADEGPFPEEFRVNEYGFAWLEATPAQVERKYAILNAMYLPGVDPTDVGVHERSSPVNTFRYVMNAYFGADLPLLPDSVFLSPDYGRLYDFVEIERAADGAPIMPGAGGAG